MRRGLPRAVIAAIFLLLGVLMTPAGASTSTLAISPTSMSFQTADTGWILGLVPCQPHRLCYHLEWHGTFAGIWTGASLPSLLRRSIPHKNASFLQTFNSPTIEFANNRDGWIYGRVPTSFDQYGEPQSFTNALWTTLDGGKSWHSLNLKSLNSGGGVLDVQTHGSKAYLIGVSETLGIESVWSTRVGTDTWTRMPTPQLVSPAGGTAFQAGIAFAGSRAWLVEGNDRGVSGSLELTPVGRWVKWTPPCETVGDSYMVPAAPSPTNLVAVCVMGGFAYDLSKSAPPGATLGSSWLYFSTDGGKSFHAGPELSSPHSRSANNDFTSAQGTPAAPEPGVYVLTRWAGSPKPVTLIESTDSGRSWTTVYRGSMLDVAFVSNRSGFGIVQTSPLTSVLIASEDGGRHWSPIAIKVSG